MHSSLGKNEILRGRRRFRTVVRHGSRLEAKHLRCLYLAEEPTRCSISSRLVFGITLSRSITSAVHRNRVKRLIRESFRRNKALLHQATGSEHFLLLFSVSSPHHHHSMPPTLQEVDVDMRWILLSIILRDRL